MLNQLEESTGYYLMQQVKFSSFKSNIRQETLRYSKCNILQVSN